jgi:hypothetical protein
MVGPLHGNNASQVQTSASASSTFGSKLPNNQSFEDTLATLAAGNKGIIIITANNPLIPKPSLFAYMQAVSLASVRNQSETDQESADINRIAGTFYKDLIFNANNMLSLLFLVLTIQTQSQQLAQDANTLNNAENSQINQYNEDVSNDAAQSQTINTAATTFNTANALFQQQTQQFKNGNISAAEYAQDQATFNQAQSTYNAATANYNNYIATRNPQIAAYNASAADYNNKLQQLNAAIGIINAERASLGIPPLPLLTPISSNVSALNSASTSPPAPVTVPPAVNPASVPTIPTYVQPQPTDLVNSIFIPLFQLRMAVVGQTENGLQQIVNVQAFADYFLQTKSSIFALPPAFTSQMAATTGSFTGVGSDAGLAAISSALDPVMVARLLNQSAQNALSSAVTSVLKPGTIDATLLATATTLSNASISNASQMLQMLRETIQGIANSEGADESTVDKALSLGLVRNILDFVSRKDLSQALEDFVSPEEKNNPLFQLAVKALNSSIDLSLIGVALGFLSAQLGLPGLGAQILGLAGANSNSLFNATGNGISFNDFAFNPFSSAFVANTISSQLANLIGGVNGYSLSDIQKLQYNLQSAFTYALSTTSPYAGPEQLFANLAQGLQNSGITGDLAASVLSAAGGIFSEPAFSSRVDFRNNLQQSLVNQGFSSDDALQIASSIAGVSPSSTADELLNANTIDTSLLVANLAYNISLSGGIVTASSIASQVVGAALANTQEISEATLRDNLVHALTVEGIQADLARRIVAGTAIPSSNDDLLSSSVYTSQLTQGQLHDELTASIKGIYSPLLGNQQANLQAQQLADFLVGPSNANVKEISENANPLSLVSTIRDNLNSLKNQNDQASFNNAIDNYSDYLKPSTQLYAYFEKLNNPADLFLKVDNLLNATSPTTGPVNMGGTNPSLEVPI